ncbi:MAG: hypothetical protein PVSMB7_15250 [Chloroflexota bacterium]
MVDEAARDPGVPLRQVLAAIVPPYILSRSLLLAVSGIVALVRGQTLLSVWNQWDTKWYLGIAAHGYHWGMNGKPALAFFPLYPLLVHLASRAGLPAEVAGLIVSNAAFAAALLYLYLFVQAEWGHIAARRSAWLLALFPTGFFTFATYTESLFLLCAVATLYHARRRHIIITGLWAAAALATRSTGIILIPAILLALHQQRWRTRIVALAPPAAVVIGYWWYLSGEHLSIDRVLGAQRFWHRALTFPWTGFTASLAWLARHGADNAGWTTENIFQMCVTALFLALTVAAWKSLGRPEAVYCGCFWLLVLTSPEWLDNFYAPFMSMNRFVLALFPLLGWIAARANPQLFRRTLHLSALSMSVLAALHVAGGWVG